MGFAAETAAGKMLKKFNDKQISRILFLTGILLLFSEIWKQITINLVLKAAGEGRYCWWYFPFQLCSTPMYMCLLLPLTLRKGREGLRDAILTYLATFGLLAGTVTFADTGGFSELGYLPLTVHSWVWHIVMVLMGLFCFAYLSAKGRNHLPGAVGIYLAGCVIAEAINLPVGKHALINMFYISPLLPMNQICFRDIAAYLGNGVGIFVYVTMTIIGAVTLDIALLCSGEGRG